MGTNEQVFIGTILSTDGVICEELEILGYRSRRGSGDGLLWRGLFTLPRGIRTPSVGATLYIRLADGSQISLVVTETVRQSVCFRARGRLPDQTTYHDHGRLRSGTFATGTSRGSHATESPSTDSSNSNAMQS